MSSVAFTTSPRTWARLCGLLYLYIVVAGTFAELGVRARLIVPTDAAVTAANLAAHERLFRLGFFGELLHLACDAGVAVLLFALLRSAGPLLSGFAAVTRLACGLLLAAGSITHFAALRLLRGDGGLASFSGPQREELALFALRLHGDAYTIALFFFAFSCLALGVLIARSGFLPRALGALMALAGACYLVQTATAMLAPGLAGALFPWIFLPIFVAETALALWLLIRGIDETRWRAAFARPTP